jgi:hypothetical protein
MITRLVRFLEILGGARPISGRSSGRLIALGVWWFVLFLVVYATIGRATKFIYVDF